MVEPPEKDRQPPDKAGWIENLAKRSTGLPKDEASSSDTGSQGEKSPWAYAGLGIQFAGTVCLFAYLGHVLDRWQGWNNWGLITLSLVAVIGNMYLLIKESIKQDQPRKK